MCGIAGFVYPKTKDGVALRVLDDMCKALHHRGPDASGKFYDPVWGLGLAQTRLSIVDLSSAGDQPFIENNHQLVYNGEIYNNGEMRIKLNLRFSDIKWRGHSDTETLFHALKLMGVEWTLDAIKGMFAFAFFDKLENKLYLGRDIAGEKPLYYKVEKNKLVFGSELKAIKEFPGQSHEIDPLSMSNYLKYGYTGRDRSIYVGIRKLPAATFLVFDVNTFECGEHKYWDLERQLGGKTSITNMKSVLTNAIGRQLVADVEVGCFLSGGVDSSLIAILASQEIETKLQTFSVGFSQKSHDESAYAKYVAERIKSKHHSITCEPHHAREFLVNMSKVYDEPFGDSSQIPTFLVSKLASDHVKVSLSGDGADELFGGYTRYSRALTIWRNKERCPRIFRNLISEMIKRAPQCTFTATELLFRNQIKIRDKALKFSDFLTQDDFKVFYGMFVSYWKTAEILDKQEKLSTRVLGDTKVQDPLLYMRKEDFYNYLQEDILVKVDRAAMANSLETRAPFLDKDVITAAFQMEDMDLMRKGSGKYVLKNMLKEYLPSEFVDRKKMGFGVPMEHWLRSDLKPWAADLIHYELPSELGINQTKILEKWYEHQSGSRNWQNILWNILALKSWYVETHAT